MGRGKSQGSLRGLRFGSGLLQRESITDAMVQGEREGWEIPAPGWFPASYDKSTAYIFLCSLHHADIDVSLC